MGRRWLGLVVVACLVGGWFSQASSALTASSARVRQLDYPPALLVQGVRFHEGYSTTGTGTALVRFKLVSTASGGSTLSLGSFQVPAGQGKQKATLEIPKAAAPDVYDLVACIGQQCVTAGTPIMVWTGKWSRHSGPGPVASLFAGSGAVTKTIGPAGGTLSTSDSRGNRFTLTIPKNAVGTPTAITMTPLSSVSGQPGAYGFKAGVELTPAGTLLFQPAKLTVTTAGQVPWAGRTWFAAQDNGDDFHLDPTPPDSSGAPPSQLNSEPNTQTVTELDTQGLSNTPAADVAAQQDVPPPDPGAQVAAQITEILAGARDQIVQQNLSGGAERSVEDAAIAYAQQLATQYLDAVIKNELDSAAAKTDDTAALAAIKDAMEWARTAELLGADSNSTDAKVFPKVSQLIFNAYQRAQKRCAQEHRLTEIGDHIIPYARDLVLLGVFSEPSAEELFKCARFRVVLNSHATSTLSPPGDSGNYDYTYQATVSGVKSSGAFPLTWTGLGSGSYPSASGSDTQQQTCPDGSGNSYNLTTSLVGTNGNSVTVLNFEFPIRSADAALPIKLTIKSSASENYQTSSDVQCGQSSGTTFTNQSWWDIFTAARFATQTATSGPDNSLVLTLDKGSGELFAQKTYSLHTNPQPGTATFNDDTTIQVFHTP